VIAPAAAGATCVRTSRRERAPSAMAAESKTTAITAAVIGRNSIFMSPTSDLVAQDSTIVIQRSNLQDRHYENHQKHRHAFARGLLNHRWSFRVRLEFGSSHLPTLPCRASGGLFYSHRQIKRNPVPNIDGGGSSISNTCRTTRRFAPVGQSGASAR